MNFVEFTTDVKSGHDGSIFINSLQIESFYQSNHNNWTEIVMLSGSKITVKQSIDEVRERLHCVE
jgi:uncharacterized protein YlzI (FlbEa/FlbD family)